MIPLRAYLAGGMLAFMVLFSAVEWAQKVRAVNKLAQTEASYARLEQSRAEAARAAEAKARNLEHDRDQTGQRISDAYQTQLDSRDTQLRVERSGADRLRSIVAAYAADSGAAGQACPPQLEGSRHRAATLGDLLTQADSLAGDFADAAERHADEARALMARVRSDRQP